MKKLLLTLSLSVFTVAAFSQAKLELGLKVGANFASANVDNINSDGITSFHGGAYLLAKLGNIGVQPELLFSKQGSEFTGGSEIDLNYVNIPVMLKFYLPLGLNLQVGPQFGVLTGAEDEGGTDIKDRFKNSDLSAAFGAGWDAPFGLNLTARYILGLSDINDNPFFQETRNRTFQLAVGYRLFKLGR